MICFDSNLKKALAVFVLFITLKDVAGRLTLSQCREKLTNILGLNTIPAECIEKIIQNIRVSLENNIPLQNYAMQLLKPEFEVFKLTHDFCDLTVRQMLLLERRIITPDELAYRTLQFNTNYYDYFANCENELLVFGSTKQEIIRNAIKFHKIKTPGIVDTAYENYYVHEENSYSAAFLKHISDTLKAIRAVTENPEQFCVRVTSLPPRVPIIHID